MTSIHEENTNMPEIIEESFDYSEIFDATKFTISVECSLCDKDIAW